MAVCGNCHADAAEGAWTCAACGASLTASSGEDGLVGKTLRGVYLVQERIAAGPRGTVYKAVHTALDAPFAVKVLRQGPQPDLAMVARFRQEARALSRLRHPNVVAVTDFGQTEDGTLFVVMEYVAGKSLARVVAEQAPLPEERVVRIGAQILAALAEAHARQVLHGALSPKDVMLESRRDPPDSVKVLDFGVANLHLAGAAQGPGTQAALALGIAAYMSPEQREGGDLDARSDLYAAGVVLYEMLTGRLPFDADAPPPAAGRKASPPTPSARLGRPVSPELEALVLRALSPHRFERPDGAAEMREELLRCAIAREATDATDETDCGPTAVLPRPEPAAPAEEPPSPEQPAAEPPGESSWAESLRAGDAPVEDLRHDDETTAGAAEPPRDRARMSPAVERATRAAPRTATPVPPPATARAPPRGPPAATTRAAPRATPPAATTRAAPRATPPAATTRAAPRATPPAATTRAAPSATPPAATTRATPRATPSTTTRATPRTTPASTTTRATPPGARRTVAQGALGRDVLQDIERRAVPILGPVAPYLVAKAGAVAGTVEELCDIVASFIPSEGDRTKFLAAVSSATATRTRAAPRERTQAHPPVAWDPALLDRARRALAAHIGPVARVVVQRASAAARTPEQLCELLAREIADDAGRAAFRRAVAAPGDARR